MPVSLCKNCIRNVPNLFKIAMWPKIMHINESDLSLR